MTPRRRCCSGARSEDLFESSVTVKLPGNPFRGEFPEYRPCEADRNRSVTIARAAGAAGGHFGPKRPQSGTKKASRSDEEGLPDRWSQIDSGSTSAQTYSKRNEPTWFGLGIRSQRLNQLPPNTH